jgi:hypothetical protein
MSTITEWQRAKLLKLAKEIGLCHHCSEKVRAEFKPFDTNAHANVSKRNYEFVVAELKKQFNEDFTNNEGKQEDFDGADFTSEHHIVQLKVSSPRNIRYANTASCIHICNKCMTMPQAFACNNAVMGHNNEFEKLRKLIETSGKSVWHVHCYESAPGIIVSYNIIDVHVLLSTDKDLWFSRYLPAMGTFPACPFVVVSTDGPWCKRVVVGEHC